MSTYRVRNDAHLDGCRRLRDLVRARFPGQGLVATDLDVILRWHGGDLDADGRFALVEVKHGAAPLTQGQRWTFGVLDRMLKGGPEAGRYLGLWTIHDHGDAWTIDGDRRRLTDDDLVERLTAWRGAPR